MLNGKGERVQDTKKFLESLYPLCLSGSSTNLFCDKSGSSGKCGLAGCSKLSGLFACLFVIGGKFLENA
jgi:hypothetical protein